MLNQSSLHLEVTVIRQSGVYEINIKGVKKETEETVVQVTEVAVICLPLARPQVDTEVLQKFDHLNLAMIL